jgi:hypothetical protein
MVRRTRGATVKDRGFFIVAIPSDDETNLVKLNFITAARQLMLNEKMISEDNCSVMAQATERSQRHGGLP